MIRKPLTIFSMMLFLAFTFAAAATLGDALQPPETGTNHYMLCISNSDCNAGFFCEKLIGKCDGKGVCILKPDNCTDLYMPVCGCDGVTYGNACEAAGAGVSIDYSGECKAACDVCLLGDINHNCAVDISDVIHLLRCALGSGPCPQCADINNDGVIDVTDVILALRMAVHLDPVKECSAGCL